MTSYVTGEESIMCADQYSRQVDIPHSVERYAEHMVSVPDDLACGTFAGGATMWSLWKTTNYPSANDDGRAYATSETAIAEAKRIFNL